MPVYPFECDECGQTDAVFAKMDDCGAEQMCLCGHEMRRVYGRVNVEVFKPFIEEGFDGKPIEITSKAQRDALCAQHNMSYDTHKYHRKAKVKSAIDDITFDDVQGALAAGVADNHDTAIQQFIDEGRVI